VNLMPRSLGGQLVLLMLGGFIVGSLFAVIGMWSQDGGLHPIAREHALSRTVTAYRLAKQQPRGNDRWLHSFNTHVARLWIDQQSDAIAMNAREQELASSIGQRLSASVVRVHIPCRHHGIPELLLKPGKVDSSVQCVEINLALAEGHWLRSLQLLPVQSLWRESWHLLRFSFLLGIPPVLMVMYLFVNRILHPTTALTEAAERMSRGERIDPLQIQGPDEIREISVAFNHMHERITRFVDERTRMLAAISHDMRTPLTVLELQAVMLPESEQRSEMLKTLAEIREMINQTLEFASYTARHEDSVEIDLASMLRAICRLHASAEHRLELMAPPKLNYTCRVQAMKRALNNLIENSVKHATSIYVQLQDNGSDGVEIKISDNGPGIPENMLERVFEPFFQIDEVRPRDSGSSVGLGLAIVRDCIQAHGGSIQLHNQAQGGLLSLIYLPPAHGG
jgi:signal transduction histidine kinase